MRIFSNNHSSSSTDFQIHRGGCIICVDYSYFVAEPSFMGYVKAVLLFTPLAARMKHIADSILAEGFSPDSGMLWGMSFGAQLLLHVGKSLGGCIAKGHCMCQTDIHEHIH